MHYLRKFTLLLCVGLILSQDLLAEEFRTWTSVKTKQRVIAKLIDYDGKIAKLVTREGSREVRVIANVLTSADRRYLLTWLKRKRTDEANDNQPKKRTLDELDQRMAELATELGLPTKDGLPWYQPSSFWLPNRMNARFDANWRRLSDRIHLTYKNDYLGIEDTRAVSFYRLRDGQQDWDRKLENQLERARSRISLTMPTFIINHFSAKEYQPFIDTITRNGKISLGSRSSNGWKGDSPAQRESITLGFIRQYNKKLEDLKIALPVRYIVSHKAFVSVYDAKTKSMPITYQFPSGRDTSESLPFPGVTRQYGASNDLKVPVSGFQPPKAWPTDATTARSYGRPDPRNRDGMQTVWIAYTVKIDQIPDKTGNAQSQTQLISTVESVSLYKDETLRSKLHDFPIDESSHPAQIRPLAVNEATSPVINPHDHLQMASLAVAKQADIFDLETWANIWMVQKKFDLRRTSQTTGRFTNIDRPFFANQQESNGRPTELTWEEIEPLRAYMIHHGNNFETIEILCRFKVDGYGPTLDLGSILPEGSFTTSPTKIDNRIPQYVTLEKVLNQAWRSENRFRNATMTSIDPKDFVLGLSDSLKSIINRLPQTVKDRVAQKPSEAYCRLTLDLVDAEILAGQQSQTILALLGKPDSIEVSIFDTAIPAKQGASWQDRLKVISSLNFDDPSTQEAEENKEKLSTAAGRGIHPQPFSQATFPMIAAKHIDGFVESRSDQLMRWRHQHEIDFRQDPKGNRYGVVPSVGAFFQENDAAPIEREQRDRIRDKFESWYVDAAERLPDRFEMKTQQFKFDFDPQTQTFSPVLFRDATVPASMPDAASRIRSMEESTNDQCITYETFQDQYPDGLPEGEGIRVRDIARYKEHTATTPLDLVFGSKLSIRAVDGTDQQIADDKATKRVNKFGIPIAASQVDRPIHAVLRLDKELRLDPKAKMRDDDIKLAIHIVFDVKKAALQTEPPVFIGIKALEALIGKKYSGRSRFNDTGDYVIIDTEIVSAAIVNAETGNEIFPLELHSPIALQAIRPPVPNIFKNQGRGLVPGIDTKL